MEDVGKRWRGGRGKRRREDCTSLYIHACRGDQDLMEDVGKRWTGGRGKRRGEDCTSLYIHACRGDQDLMEDVGRGGGEGGGRGGGRIVHLYIYMPAGVTKI